MRCLNGWLEGMVEVVKIFHHGLGMLSAIGDCVRPMLE